MADPIGQLPWLDMPMGALSRRFGGKVASTAALTALLAKQRADGMVVVVQPSGSGTPDFWVWDDAGEEAATANILEADDSPTTGRWKRTVSSGAEVPAGTFKFATIAGQDETSDTTIPLTGLAVGDELVMFLVFDTGVPAARALTDFTVSANTITVGANAANNTGNVYVVGYVDKT